MVLLGYALTLLVGVSLSLMGGGGSILMVPILLYVFGVNAVSATAYSLFIVGIASGVGAYGKWKQGLVNFKVGVTFFVPGFLGVLASRALIIPSLPDSMGNLGSLLVTKDLLIMVVFAVTMILASISMIRGRKETPGADSMGAVGAPVIVVQGLFTGLLTGFVGAGGGFLIIPALVLFARLPMKMAVGTSLFIITINSLLGFLGDVMVNPNIQWKFLITLALISMLGIVVGSRFSKNVSERSLKKAFGYFVLVMGSFILLQQIYR